MDLDQQLKLFYDEIGERCPFKLAKHYGIDLGYHELGDDICGLYYRNPLGNKKICINLWLDTTNQERTCCLLIEHSRLQEGVCRNVVRNELQQFPEVS